MKSQNRPSFYTIKTIVNMTLYTDRFKQLIIYFLLQIFRKPLYIPLMEYAQYAHVAKFSYFETFFSVCSLYRAGNSAQAQRAPHLESLLYLPTSMCCLSPGIASVTGVPILYHSLQFSTVVGENIIVAVSRISRKTKWGLAVQDGRCCLHPWWYCLRFSTLTASSI